MSENQVVKETKKPKRKERQPGKKRQKKAVSRHNFVDRHAPAEGMSIPLNSAMVSSEDLSSGMLSTSVMPDSINRALKKYKQYFVPILMPAIDAEITGYLAEFVKKNPTLPDIPPKDQPPQLIDFGSMTFISTEGTPYANRDVVQYAWYFRLPERRLLEPLSALDFTAKQISRAMMDFKEVETLWCDFTKDKHLKGHDLVPSLVDQVKSPHDYIRGSEPPDAYYFTIRQGILGQQIKAGKERQILTFCQRELKVLHLRQQTLEGYLDRVVPGLQVGDVTPVEPPDFFRLLAADPDPKAENRVIWEEKFGSFVVRSLNPKIKRYAKRTGIYLKVKSNGRPGNAGAATKAWFEIDRLESTVAAPRLIQVLDQQELVLHDDAVTDSKASTEVLGFTNRKPRVASKKRSGAVKKDAHEYLESGELTPLVQQKLSVSRSDAIDISNRYVKAKGLVVKPTTPKMWAQYIKRWYDHSGLLPSQSAQAVHETTSPNDSHKQEGAPLVPLVPLVNLFDISDEVTEQVRDYVNIMVATKKGNSGSSIPAMTHMECRAYLMDFSTTQLKKVEDPMMPRTHFIGHAVKYLSKAWVDKH